MKIRTRYLVPLLAVAVLGFGAAAGSAPDIIPEPQEAKWGGKIGGVEGRLVTLLMPSNYKPGFAADKLKEVLSRAGAYLSSQASMPREADIIVHFHSAPKDVPDAEKALKGKGPMDVVWASETMLPADGQGYVLDISKIKDKIRIVIDAKTEIGLLYGVQTLEQILFPQRGKTGELWQVRIVDWPMFPLRGVIEGGGGHWTHEQRMWFLTFMGTVKMNYFLYIPKGDSKVRREWRKPYTDEEMAQFKEEIDLAQKNGIHFAYGSNPALNFCAASDKTFEALKQKFDRFMALGVDQFGIFFDDVIPLRQCKADREKFKSAAEAHAFLSNRLSRYLKTKNPKAQFFMCPTPYWTIADYGYFQDLKKYLDRDIAVGWTGYGVAPDSVPLENAKKFYEITGHPIGIGDNYPVHADSLCFGPVRQRDPKLYKYIPSFVANPAWSRPVMTSIPLSTIADYTWNPVNYDPDKSWLVTLRRFAGDDWFDDLFTIAELYVRGWPNFAKPSRLELARKDLKAAFDADKPLDAPLDKLETEYKRAGDAVRRFESGFPITALIEEIKRGDYLKQLTDLEAQGLEKIAGVRESLASGDKEAVKTAMKELEAVNYSY